VALISKTIASECLFTYVSPRCLVAQPAALRTKACRDYAGF
jgi:hypothetical protein